MRSLTGRRAARSRVLLVGLLAGSALVACSSCLEDLASNHEQSPAMDAAWTPPTPDFPGANDEREFWLSQTGLYRDLHAKQLAPDLIEFEPAYALWSDGAKKRRWLRLPQGTRIDSSDMDHWQFPVGSMLFKEFSLAGKRIETRVIARTGASPSDYFMGAFVWNDDESDARFTPLGLRDARGTEHDVPRLKNCFTCHNGDSGRVLGFSAVQRPVPALLPQLLNMPPDETFHVPGDEVTAAALGYLHANCGHCHNPGGAARPDTDMDLRLAVADDTPEHTNTHRTTVGRALQYFQDTTLVTRVVPGDADRSGLLFRMTQRGPRTQMPALGSEIIDPDGIERVRRWIDAL